MYVAWLVWVDYAPTFVTVIAFVMDEVPLSLLFSFDFPAFMLLPSYPPSPRLI